VDSKLQEQATELQKLIDELKSGKMGHSLFFQKSIEILSQMEVDDKLLQGVIPYLVSCINNIVRNNS
jgi:hypothetical protein